MSRMLNATPGDLLHQAQSMQAFVHRVTEGAIQIAVQTTGVHCIIGNLLKNHSPIPKNKGTRG
jgi:hypothetical protein